MLEDIHIYFVYSHRPHIHFRPVFPVGQQFRSRVSRTATLSVQQLQRERLCLQSVTQTKVCTQTHSYVSVHAYKHIILSTVSDTHVD